MHRGRMRQERIAHKADGGIIIQDNVWHSAANISRHINDEDRRKIWPEYKLVSSRATVGNTATIPDLSNQLPRFVATISNGRQYRRRSLHRSMLVMGKHNVVPFIFAHSLFRHNPEYLARSNANISLYLVGASPFSWSFGRSALLG